MRITILGIGNMGSALAHCWSANHQVCLSYSRDENKLSTLAAELKTAQVMPNLDEAIRFAEVVMIATPYEGLDEIFHHENAFSGKFVISCVSNLMPDFTGSTIGLATKRSISVAEEIAQRLPSARVVEAFNLAFAENLKSSTHRHSLVAPSVFYCGDDNNAKLVADQLIRECGYEAINAGPLISSRSQETLATAWVQFAVASGLYPQIAFKAILG